MTEDRHQVSGDAGGWGAVLIPDLCHLTSDLGAVAQLGERLLCKQEVTGSIPVGSTRADQTSSRRAAPPEPTRLLQEERLHQERSHPWEKEKEIVGSGLARLRWLDPSCGLRVVCCFTLWIGMRLAFGGGCLVLLRLPRGGRWTRNRLSMGQAGKTKMKC